MANISLRKATIGDVATLLHWDKQPHVIRFTQNPYFDDDYCRVYRLDRQQWCNVT